MKSRFLTSHLQQKHVLLRALAFSSFPDPIFKIHSNAHSLSCLRSWRYYLCKRKDFVAEPVTKRKNYCLFHLAPSRFPCGSVSKTLPLRELYHQLRKLPVNVSIIYKINIRDLDDHNKFIALVLSFFHLILFLRQHESDSISVCALCYRSYGFGSMERCV